MLVGIHSEVPNLHFNVAPAVNASHLGWQRLKFTVLRARPPNVNKTQSREMINLWVEELCHGIRLAHGHIRADGSCVPGSKVLNRVAA